MVKIIKYYGAPGTGKTTRLILDIKKLIDEGYQEEEFTVTTFSRRMADEIESRLGFETQGNVNTMHGICKGLASIYKDDVVGEKYQKEFCIFSGMEYDQDVNTTTEDKIPTTLTAKSKLGNLFFNAKSFIANNMIQYSKIHRWGDIDRLEQEVPDPAKFVETMDKKYQDWKKERNLYDFDDMLLTVQKNKLIPSTRVLIVDEFQDFTPLQFNIFTEWIKTMELVIVAGDPRQTLYSFTGATSDFFDGLEGELRVLDTTYRLPENIWNYAKQILDRAKLSYPEIKTTGKPGLLKNISEAVYYERLFTFTQNTLHLVRTNEMGKNVAYALIDAGIPFDGIYGWGTNQINLYNSILKVRAGMRGESVTLTASEIECMLAVFPKKNLWISKKKDLTDTKAAMDFTELKNHGTDLLWAKINSAAVLEKCNGGYGDSEALSHKKIATALQKHNKLLDSITVAVLTIHRAKGEEANNVFLHDELNRIIANLLYSEMSEKSIKDEAQVFYVGATRAKQALFIVNSNESQRYFLPEINEVRT